MASTGRRKKQRAPEEGAASFFQRGFLRNTSELPAGWRSKSRPEPEPQPQRRLLPLEYAYWREHQIKIASLHFLNSKRFSKNGNQVPFDTDFAVISRFGDEHKRVFYLDRPIARCGNVTCSCLRARPDLGGCGGGCDGAGAGGGAGGCGCDTGGGAGAGGCGCSCGADACGGCGQAGGGPGGAGMGGGPGCGGGACSCEGGCPGGACGACSTGGGGCTGCSGGCGADCAGGGGPGGCGQPGFSADSPGVGGGVSADAGACGVSADAGACGVSGGVSADAGAFGGGPSGGFAGSPSGGFDVGAVAGAADIGFGGFGGMPADVGFGTMGFGPESEQDQGSGRGGFSSNLSMADFPGAFTAAQAQAAEQGHATDFADPGVYSASTPANLATAAAYGSIVGPAETSVELGQSIADQNAALTANAALNSPSMLAPSVVAQLTQGIQSGLTTGQLAAMASAMGVSPSGPFGNFAAGSMQDMPAPSPPGQGIRVTDTPLLPPTLPGDTGQNVGLGDVAAADQFAPSGDTQLAGPSGADQFAPSGDTQFAGVVQGDQGGFAPDTFDMLTGGQTAAADTTTAGGFADTSGGFTGGGGGGGDFALPSDLGFGAGNIDLGNQYAALDTNVVSDVSAGPYGGVYAGDRDRQERQDRALTPEGFPSQAALAAQGAPGQAWSPSSLAFMGGTNDPQAAAKEIAAGAAAPATDSAGRDMPFNPTYDPSDPRASLGNFAAPRDQPYDQPSGPLDYRSDYVSTGPAAPVDTSIPPEGFERPDQGRAAVAQSDQPAPGGAGVQPVDQTMPPGAFERADTGRGAPYGQPYAANVPPTAEPQAPGPGRPTDVPVPTPTLEPPEGPPPMVTPGPVAPGERPTIVPSEPPPPAPTEPTDRTERARPVAPEPGLVQLPPPGPGPEQQPAPPPTEPSLAGPQLLGPMPTVPPPSPPLSEREQQEQQRQRQQQQEEEEQRQAGLVPLRLPSTGAGQGLAPATAPTEAVTAGVAPTLQDAIAAGRTTTAGDQRQQIEPPATTLPPISPERAAQLPPVPPGAPAVAPPRGAPPAPPEAVPPTAAETSILGRALEALQSAIVSPAEAKARGQRAQDQQRYKSSNLIPPNATQDQIGAHIDPNSQRAQERQKFSDQIARDPQLLDRLLKVLHAEAGSSGSLAKTTAVAESILNRANQHYGGDLSKALADNQFNTAGLKGGYFPGTSSPSAKGATSSELDQQAASNALAGSDLIRGATGNETGTGGRKGTTAQFTGAKNLASVGEGKSSDERFGMEAPGTTWTALPVGPRTGAVGRAQARTGQFSPARLAEAEKQQPLRAPTDQKLDFTTDKNVNITRMNPAALQAFNRAYQDFVKQGGDASSAHATSGYRPATENQARQMQDETPGVRSQEAIQHDKLAGRVRTAAPIGRSLHGTGNGMDLKLGAFRTWLEKNGAQYGLYPILGGLKGRDPFHVEYHGARDTAVARAAPATPAAPRVTAEQTVPPSGYRGPDWGVPPLGPPPMTTVPAPTVPGPPPLVAAPPAIPGLQVVPPIGAAPVSPGADIPGLAGGPSGEPAPGRAVTGPAGAIPPGVVMPGTPMAPQPQAPVVTGRPGAVPPGVIMPGTPMATSPYGVVTPTEPGLPGGAPGAITRGELPPARPVPEALPAGPGAWGDVTPREAGARGTQAGLGERPAVEPTAEEMGGGYQPSVGAGGVQPGAGVPGAPGAQAGETRGGYALTAPPAVGGGPGGITPIAEPTETAGVPGLVGTQAGPAPEGRPAAPTPPTEAPPTERPAEERAAAQSEETQRAIETIAGLHAVAPPAPAKPEIKTPAQRTEEAFRAGQLRMTPEERAQAKPYEHFVTPALKQALVDGKISVYDFMSKSSGGKYSAEYIKSVGQGQAFGSQVSGYDKVVQKSVADLQRVVNDAKAGIVSDRAAQAAYDKALGQFGVAMSGYERGLYESYQTAQQGQQPSPAVPSQPIPPPAAAPYPYDPSAYEQPPFAPAQPPPPVGPIEIGPERQERPGEGPPPMTPTPPLSIRPPDTPGGIREFGPDPNVDYYSVPPYAPPAVTPPPPAAAPPARPVAPAPPSVAPPAPPSVVPAPPSVAPPAAAPSPMPQPAIPPGAPYVPPSYFGGNEQAIVSGVQTALRRDPARFAALMDANPQMGMMLASIFTPAQLSQMFADVGFSHGEPNPPMGGSGNQQNQNQPQGQAQGGLVDMPGYYQAGGELANMDRAMRAVPSYVWGVQAQPARRWPTSPVYHGAEALPQSNPSPENPGPRWDDMPSEPLHRQEGGDADTVPLPRPRPDVTNPTAYPVPNVIGQISPEQYAQLPRGSMPVPSGPLATMVPSNETLGRLVTGLQPAPSGYYSEANRAGGGGYDLLVDRARWEAFLAAQPRSTNIERRAQGGLVPLPYQRGGGLGIPQMNAAFKQAHFTGVNTRAAIPKPPGIHLINSSVPGRVDRIPMNARTGSYVIPAHAVSGMGQGNTLAGAKMWGDAISHSIGPMGIANAMRARSLKTPSLRMPSPRANPRDYSGPLYSLPMPGVGGRGAGGFADGGDTGGGSAPEFTPIITAGGELVIDPEIVHAMGGGDAEVGKKRLADSVAAVTDHTAKEMKKLPGPVE